MCLCYTYKYYANCFGSPFARCRNQCISPEFIYRCSTMAMLILVVCSVASFWLTMALSNFHNFTNLHLALNFGQNTTEYISNSNGSRNYDAKIIIIIICSPPPPKNNSKKLQINWLKCTFWNRNHGKPGTTCIAQCTVCACRNEIGSIESLLDREYIIQTSGQ